MSTFGKFKYGVNHGFFNTIDTEEKAYELHQQGLTMVALGKHFGCSD